MFSACNSSQMDNQLTEKWTSPQCSGKSDAMIQPTDNPKETTIGSPIFWLAIAVVGLGFFLTEQNLNRSLQEEFTFSAETLEQAVAGGNSLRRMAFSAIAMLGVLFLLRNAGPRLSARDPLALLVLAVLAICLASLLWSSDPALTVRRLVVLGFCFLGALGIARQLSARQLCAAVLIVPTAYVAIGILAELKLGTFRPWAAGYRFSGTVHPNTQAGYCGLLCLAAVAMAGDAKRGKALLRPSPWLPLPAFC